MPSPSSKAENLTKRSKLVSTYLPVLETTPLTASLTVVLNAALTIAFTAALKEALLTHHTGQVYVRMHKALHATLVSNVSTQCSGLSYTDFENGPKRYLLSPPDIRLIDSVYRTRDFDLARRGIKPLVKSWDEDDGNFCRTIQGDTD